MGSTRANGRLRPKPCAQKQCSVTEQPDKLPGWMQMRLRTGVRSTAPLLSAVNASAAYPSFASMLPAAEGDGSAPTTVRSEQGKPSRTIGAHMLLAR